MKKLWSSLVLVMLLVLGVAFADFSYIVKSYQVDGTNIEKNDTFKLTINLERLTETDTSKKLTLVNTSEDSFRLASGGTSQQIGQAMPKLDPEIELVYQGQGKTFSFNIIEDETGNVITSDKVTIKEVKPRSSDDGDSSGGYRDTSNYKPNFDLKSNPFDITFGSKKNYQIKATLANVSKYGAKNVRAQIVAGNDSLPFDLAESTLKKEVRYVARDKAEDFIFDLKVAKTAVSKTYNLKLLLEYDNTHGNHFTQEIPLNIIVNSSERKPIVTIEKYEIVGGELEANKAATLNLDFKVEGTYEAKNISVTLTGFSADGITLNGGSATQYMSLLNPDGYAQLSYNIMAMPKASGVQALIAKINYSDEAGNSYEREEQIFIRLKSQSDQTVNGVDIKFLSKKYSLLAGGETVVSASVTNNSEAKIDNLKVELSANGSINLLSSYIDYIESLAVGETRTFNYTIGASEGSSEGTYPLQISIADSEDESKKQIDVTAINIMPDAAGSGKSKPKIIISQYDYGDKSVLAGKSFPLTVTFTNTSQVMGIRNVKASFTSEGNVFLPVESANSFYVDNIPAGGSVTKTVNLITKNDTEPKIYSLNFEMNYEDAEGRSYDAKDQPYKDEEQITINVKQENRLEVADISLPPMAMVGEEIALDVNFFNMGKSTMYNLLVTLEGDFDKRDGTRFVGTFAPGGNEYFSASIIPTAVGEQKGMLKFTFEDANGEAFTVEKELEFTVEEGMGDGDMMIDDGFVPGGLEGDDFNPDSMGEEKQPMAKSMQYLIGFGVLIAVVIVAVVIKRKRHKKKLMESLEDED